MWKEVKHNECKGMVPFAALDRRLAVVFFHFCQYYRHPDHDRRSVSVAEGKSRFVDAIFIYRHRSRLSFAGVLWTQTSNHGRAVGIVVGHIFDVGDDRPSARFVARRTWRQFGHWCHAVRTYHDHHRCDGHRPLHSEIVQARRHERFRFTVGIYTHPNIFERDARHPVRH